MMSYVPLKVDETLSALVVYVSAGQHGLPWMFSESLTDCKVLLPTTEDCKFEGIKSCSGERRDKNATPGMALTKLTGTPSAARTDSCVK